MTESRTKERTEGSSVAASAPAADSVNVRATTVQTAEDWWYVLDQRVHACIKMWLEGEWWGRQRHVMTEAMGEVLAKEREKSHEAITKLTERVIRVEAAANFEERFNRLAHEIKRGSEIPQSESLKKIDALQRQLNELKTVIGLDERVRELAERVGELEKTNSLEARFAKLANEAKGGSETQQSELLARIEGLQRQLDELKRVAAQPGPPGPPGKLPLVREYAPEHVHYERDVVTHAGALWQAQCDTVHAPPHDDWALLARAGRDGLTPTVRGTYNANEPYKQLDIVALDGAAFIAKKNGPGLCPGSDWQMISRQGRQGRRGECGPVGPAGKDGKNAETRVIRLEGWRIEPEKYAVVPQMLDGRQVIDGPELELRKLFEQFLAEVGS